MKLLVIIIFLFGGVSLFGQSPESCGKNKEIFDTFNREGYRSIVYTESDLTIHFMGEGEQIDSVLYMVSGKDTLDRFKDTEIKAFEEILPYINIPDWKLLLRINEMTTYDRREKEYHNLTRTYKQITPHLYGNFSEEGYALVKTNLGYNFINREGQLLFDCYFENATNFIEGLASVKIDGEWMSINADGVINPLKN